MYSDNKIKIFLEEFCIQDSFDSLRSGKIKNLSSENVSL